VPYARVLSSKSVPGQISSGYPYGRHLNQQTKILIRRDERRSRLPADLRAGFRSIPADHLLYRFFLKQTLSTAIAAACILSRAFGPMKYRLALILGSVPQQAVDGSPPPQASGPLSVDQLLHALTLAERARKSIEDEFTSAL
jgi:hypothetical protein